MIDIARSYTFNARPDLVWTLLMDTGALAACIPGCEDLEPAGDDCHVVKLTVRMSAVVGTYTGSVQLIDKVPMSSYGLIAEGQGRPGFVKGSATITLRPAGESTEVAVRGTVQTGGAIARMGQRLIRGAALLMMDRFFGRLKARAEGRDDDVDGTEQDAPDEP